MSTEALASLYTGRLHGSQIRLLRLLPASQDRPDAVCFELITTSLDDVAGTYHALSYVSGFPSTKKTITVNGNGIPVTANLEAALRRIVGIEKAGLIWVDAICINQTDLEERSEQVLQIKEIYSRARRVLAWLGDASKDQDPSDGRQFIQDAETAISLLKIIHHMARGRKPVNKPDPYEMFVEDITPFQDPVMFGLPNIYSEEWDSLNRFLSRAWFSRVWIIQEIAAAREARLLVGKDAEIDWEQVAGAVIWLLSNSYPDNISGLQDCWNVLIIDACRNGPPEPLFRRVSAVTNFNSTLPHDQIYALLGMTIEGKSLEQYPRLRVDYGRDWREMYRDVVRHCIETPGSFKSKRSLHALSQIRQIQNKNGNFEWEESSWVPSWHSLNQQGSVAWRNETFKAGGETEPDIADSGDERILSLKGVVVDKVAKVYSNLVGLHEEDDEIMSYDVFRAIAKIWSSVTQNWKISYHHRYPHLADAFAKVLSAAVVTKHPTTDASPGMYFAAYWDMGLSMFDGADSKFQISNFTGPVKADVQVWDHMHELMRDKRAEYLGYMARDFAIAIDLGKVVFITEKGYLGTGPSIVAPGDELCVLYGGPMPYIVQKIKNGINNPEWLDVSDASSSTSSGKLRSSMKGLLLGKKGSSKKAAEGKMSPKLSPGGDAVPQKDLYRFVGDCFVEGIMGGQALDRREAAELKEKVFHIV